GTTFADICKEAGISNGVLTYHFKDKDEILYAVLEKVGHEASLLLEGEGATKHSLRDKLLLYIHSTLACTEAQREWGLLSLHFQSLGCQRPEFASRLQQIRAKALQQLQAEIEQAMARKEIERRDPAIVATIIQMIFTGISLGSLTSNLPVSAEQLADEVLILLQRYLKMGDDDEPEQKAP
ncbi:MAG: TetR/AcrR family transcriptional regulator, partial [Ktedonobacteraceae bacterium]|nr:TetR/AcrR family transcriptional regulator [Ktedonobacteraceae bacterium]